MDWTKEEEKCFCEKWGEDDEELGIQIVKVILTKLNRYLMKKKMMC